MDYDKILSRYAAYKASTFKDLLSLSRAYTNKGYERITQANTEGCQCVLRPGDQVLNFVENVEVGDLAAMLPPGATDRDLVDEIFLGGNSIATLLNWASDEQWSRVINGRGRRAAQQLYQLIGGAMECYHIRLINSSGQLLQGFLTKNRGSDHIEAFLENRNEDGLMVWYGYERATTMNYVILTPLNHSTLIHSM
jgi:hypothetical protein